MKPARTARDHGTSWTSDVWLWLGAGVVATALLLLIGILTLIAARGLGHFWPAQLELVEYVDRLDQRQRLLGVVVEEETLSRAAWLETSSGDLAELPSGQLQIRRQLLHVGNRDLAPPDFRWLDQHRIAARTLPRDAVALERTAGGRAHGYLDAVYENDVLVASGAAAFAEATERLVRVRSLREAARELRREDIASLSNRLQTLRAERRRKAPPGVSSPGATSPGAFPSAAQDTEIDALEVRYDAILARLRDVESDLERDHIRLRLADGSVHPLSLAQIMRIWQPNAMSFAERLSFYSGSVAEFLSGSPREANTEGGIFPAIFGTVLLVLLMALLVTPLGVVAAVYMHEYARPGFGIRALRIAVNNLAGVPSIVYGVFGLGFFVYVVGGSIDELLFADRLPVPTFGSPGLLWAALTLALLTVPVVIVSTEEGLARIPREIREGCLALGATRAETLLRVVLPCASPAILTGVILAVARAAGEVAPLMLVGVVKLAPQLPVDGNFPYLHLDRPFMHLGFHIYDVGFQSPNVEAARPLVYATALLLVLIIVALNLMAIVLRSRLQRRYGAVDA